MTTFRVERSPEDIAEWDAAIADEQYAGDVIRRAIQTICTYADVVKRWGGEVDGDWIEHNLSRALDEALPNREAQRHPGPRPNERRNVTGALRTRVLERDAYRCVQCGSHVGLQVDHIHPVSRGGTNDFENLQTLCKPCNREKGDKV